jgi:hypothetical protein
MKLPDLDNAEFTPRCHPFRCRARGRCLRLRGASSGGDSLGEFYVSRVGLVEVPVRMPVRLTLEEALPITTARVR